MPYNGTTPPPKPQDPELAKRHKRVRSGDGHGGDALFVIGGLFLTFALVIGGCAVYVAHGLDNLGSGFHDKPRRHLHAIPISKSVCPNVVVMHQAANRFERATPLLGGLFDTNGHVLTWPEQKVVMRRAATQLDFLVVASTPKFPPRVQHYLAKVHKDLTAGRVQLDAARNDHDFTNRTSELLGDGQLAFGYAGDLIGHQCPVPLGADASALFGAIRVPPTTTLPAPNTDRFRKH